MCLICDENKIEEVLNDALENKIISKEEYFEINPQQKDPAVFYYNFKVHKQNEHDNSFPPVRPIISGSGSVTENISLYVENFIDRPGVAGAVLQTASSFTD